MKYLAHRLKGHEAWPQYVEACRQYLSSKEQAVHILGVLVRDITPSDDDLKTRSKALEKFVVGGRTIELVGIYVPADEIKRFPQIIREEYGRRSVSNVEE